MKNNLRKKYSILKISSLLLILTLIVSVLLTQSNSKASSKSKSDYDLINRNTFISINKDGVLKIKRDLYSNEVPMKKDDSWTIFMYVAGTNLESQYKSATTDFKEILSATYGIENLDKINIVIQTGGCNKWQSNDISNEKIQRFIATDNNKLQLVSETSLTSMGDPATLYEFLKWGAKNYPAKHMGIVFWNHGSGVENGICQDPLFKGDPLTLNEIEYALAKTTTHMTSRFDFIGFDTCLAGSLEYANILAPYSKYMVASSDLEPNNGWHYTPIIEALVANPAIEEKELCKVICESYVESYKNDPTIYNTLTMNVFDLSQVDDVCVEANYLAKYMYDNLMANPSHYLTFSNNLRKCVRYSDTTIDIGSLLSYFDNTSDFDYDTYFYRKEISELITYSRIGSHYAEKGSLGLTLYYPNSVISLNDLENIRNAIFSPYWFQFIERMGYRRCHESMEGFSESDWIGSEYFYENTFDFLNYRDYNIKSDMTMYSNLLTNHYYAADGFPYVWRKNFVNNSINYNAPFILPNTTLPSLPISRNENFCITQTHINASKKIQHKEYITQVTNSIFTLQDDNLIFLGENNLLDYNTTNNTISTSFYPEWLCLPDGQYVACNIISATENSTTYGIPVSIEGIPSTIRITESLTPEGGYKYNLLGVWDSTNGSKHTGRAYLPLKTGTTIRPMYDAYNITTGKYTTIYGNEYVVPNEFCILMSILSDGDYYYSFNIEGINGINYIANLNKFTLKDSILTN